MGCLFFIGGLYGYIHVLCNKINFLFYNVKKFTCGLLIPWPIPEAMALACLPPGYKLFRRESVSTEPRTAGDSDEKAGEPRFLEMKILNRGGYKWNDGEDGVRSVTNPNWILLLQKK
jgi:hypothetical protein